MPTETRIVGPGNEKNTVRTSAGELLPVPKGWELLPPGDAGLTRRVKSRGPSWTVQQKKGRRTFSLGVWAPADRIATVRGELQAERSTATYARRRAADAKRRATKQSNYQHEFLQAVVAFLAFHPRYAQTASELAKRVTQHATPVGSGTVARTERIPIERRAESAVIAWLRHQTTGYDDMKIPRVKGQRREIRRMLAAQSRKLLQGYRQGTDVDPNCCSLQEALLSDENDARHR